MHNGNAARGIANGSFSTGRYSKYLPPALLDAYQRSQTDNELLAVREDIALLDTLLIGNLSKLDSGESGQAWTLMRKGVDGLELAIDKQDYAGCLKAIRDMRDVIDARVAHYATEEEIRSKLEQRRKLVETERKRLVDMQQMVTAEQAMLLVSGLLDAVRTNVTDRDTLTRIQAEFIRLTRFTSQQRVRDTTE